MQFRIAPRFLLLLLLAPVSLAGVENLEACSAQESPRERSACLDRELGEYVEAGEFAFLRGLVSSMPEVVLEVSRKRTAPASEGGPREDQVRAGWLDLIGSAQFELGQFDASAESLARAILLDEGSCRLFWFSSAGDPAGAVGLDPGDRLERTVRSLLAAGRTGDAAAPLSRALSLGAGEWASQAWSELSAEPLPGRDAASAMLLADRWNKPLPAVEIEQVNGPSLHLTRDLSGEVLILSFWATWCEPCALELPRLQTLHESEKERGLRVLAVNVGEPLEIAMTFAEDLGLTIPIGTAGALAQDAFETKRLPQVVVADRRGRIRGRWSGYQEGFEEEIARLARRLLDESGPPREEVAETLLGGERFAVSWMRDAPATVDGVVVLPEAAGRPGVVVAAGRSLIHYGRDGQTLRIWKLSSSPGELRVSRVGEDGGFALFGFRPGSRSIVTIEMPEGTESSVSSPSPVFEAQVRVENGVAGSDSYRVVLATLDGLWDLSLPGGEPVSLGGVAGTSGVREIDVGRGRRLVARELGGDLCWLDDQNRITLRAEAPQDGWSLLEGGTGTVGMIPTCVSSATVGQFLSGETSEVALVTRSGQLVIVDRASGEAVFRARWPGIDDLTAGRVLGAETDDLVLTQGKRIAVLSVNRSKRHEE